MARLGFILLILLCTVAFESIYGQDSITDVSFLSYSTLTQAREAEQKLGSQELQLIEMSYEEAGNGCFATIPRLLFSRGKDRGMFGYSVYTTFPGTDTICSKLIGWVNMEWVLAPIVASKDTGLLMQEIVEVDSVLVLTLFQDLAQEITAKFGRPHTETDQSYLQSLPKYGKRHIYREATWYARERTINLTLSSQLLENKRSLDLALKVSRDYRD